MENKNPITDQQIVELKEEREYSISRWEDTAKEEIQAFDDSHSQNDWIAYLSHYTARNRHKQEEWRKDMVKVANIALAAISAYDRQNGIKIIL